MPRLARGLADGMVYHVINRGNGRQDVFHKEEDFQAFISLLREAREKFAVKLLGYCLMTNHFHLLLVPEKADDLSRFMQWLRKIKGDRLLFEIKGDRLLFEA